MRYWDASAVVPLLYSEATSGSVLAVYNGDADHATLATTRVEIECALARLLHDGRIASSQAARLRHGAKALLDSFALVAPSDAVVQAAVRLARAHPIGLRAGDAVHLAAWEAVSGGDPGAIEFVCLDRRLHEAALAEGATVLP